MKDGGKYQNTVPHLRNGFDSFTPKHNKKRDKARLSFDVITVVVSAFPFFAIFH